MKAVFFSIIQILYANGIQPIYFFKDHPKIKSLSLEQCANTPLAKAAFTLHYCFVDNDDYGDDNYDAPTEVIQGVLFYLKREGITLKNIESMYMELDNAFKEKESIEEIEVILQEHIASR